MKRFILYFCGLMFMVDAVNETQAKDLFLSRVPGSRLADIEKIEIYKKCD